MDRSSSQFSFILTNMSFVVAEARPQLPHASLMLSHFLIYIYPANGLIH